MWGPVEYSDVAVSGGRFSVQFALGDGGDNAALTNEELGGGLFVGVKIGSDVGGVELGGRHELLSVPSAVKASHAHTASRADDFMAEFREVDV